MITANEKDGNTQNGNTQDSNTQDGGAAQASEAKRPPRMTYLLLIRHGENDWVDTGKLAGRTPGVHLNEKGHAQSVALAERLKPQPLSAIYSSPLERCVETAQPLAEALSLPVREEPGVLEVDYGEWRGGVLKELAQRPEWQLVQIYPGGFRFPSGETLREVQHRVVSTVERIRQDHEGEAVAVFAHGDVIRTALAYYVGAPLDLFQRIHINTASVSVIGFHRFGPAILRMNDTGELPVISWEEPKDTQADQSAPEQSTSD
ncbi:MAG: MSMEG_4193 family putative phosphomutase [Caldilineaceae bacterium]